MTRLQDEHSPGPWRVGKGLRWNGEVLEQYMQRRVKVYPAGGGTAYTYYEHEWQPVPKVKP